MLRQLRSRWRLKWHRWRTKKQDFEHQLRAEIRCLDAALFLDFHSSRASEYYFNAPATNCQVLNEDLYQLSVCLKENRTISVDKLKIQTYSTTAEKFFISAAGHYLNPIDLIEKVKLNALSVLDCYAYLDKNPSSVDHYNERVVYSYLALLHQAVIALHRYNHHE